MNLPDPTTLRKMATFVKEHAMIASCGTIKDFPTTNKLDQAADALERGDRATAERLWQSVEMPNDGLAKELMAFMAW
jgi:hypothetical protein